jgi:ATP-dependent DNA helicase RecG
MPATRLKIFISSVQKEFAEVRSEVKAFLVGDPFLHRFVSEVFLFEQLPASDQRADHVYLAEVEHCDVYLGLFGNEYGHEDTDGVSPTDREYRHATALKKPRLIYVWGEGDAGRSAKMKKLIQRASSELIRRRVPDMPALKAEIYASLVDFLDRKGALKVPPFDTAACDDATLSDISSKRVAWFLETARRERGFPLKSSTGPESLLKHLNLLDGRRPTNAAVLLFGASPQKYHRPAETKCVSCHGTEYTRPFASQQIYGGDLFEQADQARDFVLAKLNRPVGTRDAGIRAPAAYELPPEAVGEAIVNALAHRDYHSHGSVEVRLFADRLEVWNPGALPGNLTLDDLHTDHPSIPANPLIAESLYLARYIEKAGSGTQRMIELCRAAGLPTPEFALRAGSFITTLRRDALTDAVLAAMGLNIRQRRAIVFLKSNPSLTNAKLQALSGATRKTTARDLDDLVQRGLLVRLGARRGTTYRFNPQWDIYGTSTALRSQPTPKPE